MEDLVAPNNALSMMSCWKERDCFVGARTAAPEIIHRGPTITRSSSRPFIIRGRCRLLQNINPTLGPKELPFMEFIVVNIRRKYDLGPKDRFLPKIVPILQR